MRIWHANGLSRSPPLGVPHSIDWFDPIEAGVRDRVRGFIEAMIEGELDSALLRPRYGRKPKLANEDADGSAGLTGHRHGHRSRSLMGTFGCVEIGVPRARI